MSAPAFALTGLGDSGLHGLIPEPQREYALRKFTASGFGGGEVSWERQEEIHQWREAEAKKNPLNQVCVVSHELRHRFPAGTRQHTLSAMAWQKPLGEDNLWSGRKGQQTATNPDLATE